MAGEVKNWHWRNTMKPTRFFIFDARAGFFLVLVLIHARIWTLVTMIIFLLIFWAFERKGLSFAAAVRAIRLWFSGTYRPAWVFTRRRKMIDTGSS
jgi:intracellular multiplication protein IcmT